MTLYELDPDVVRWNLHLIDVCGINNGGSLGTVTQYDTDFSQLGYAREGYSEPMHINVENDEVIAHALQEELSRLSLDESIGSSHTDEEEHRKASVLAQDWAAPSTRFSNLAVDGIQEDTDTTGFCPLTVTSSNWESPEIEDESLLDGEVGKRLNQLDAIPHVPKINGDIPSVDEAKSDHQRLMDRLEVYDLVELKVSGDGNCQFRSLSDQIYRSTEHHKFVREQVVKQYGVKMFVITSFKDTCYIEILPQSLKSNRIITLSFWAEVHYNSIYPQGGYLAD
ncbi:hypothetical protein AABB24_028150 [Solanum stoloniferum]|uniref:OTU domain-containing protein n=1 Tax=Solanum stoloniferum TaxID=62892 RepID=A0ABD2S5A9_9SOLN